MNRILFFLVLFSVVAFGNTVFAAAAPPAIKGPISYTVTINGIAYNSNVTVGQDPNSKTGRTVNVTGSYSFGGLMTVTGTAPTRVYSYTAYLRPSGNPIVIQFYETATGYVVQITHAKIGGLIPPGTTW